MTAKTIIIIIGNNPNPDDVNLITKTFEMDGFDSEIYNYVNMELTELKDRIRELKSSRWTDRFDACDFVAVFYLTPLSPDTLGDELYPIYDLRRQYFNALLKVKGLHGKLKWFVVQACSGAYYGHENLCKDNTETREMRDGVYARGYFISFVTRESELPREDDSYKNFIPQLCEKIAAAPVKKFNVPLINNMFENLPYVDHVQYSAENNCLVRRNQNN